MNAELNGHKVKNPNPQETQSRRFGKTKRATRTKTKSLKKIIGILYIDKLQERITVSDYGSFYQKFESEQTDINHHM